MEMNVHVANRSSIATSPVVDLSLTLDQLQEALEAGARSVLLDNFTLDTMRRAVEVNQGRALLEVSGGVTLPQLREIAATGVDRISIGKLTKDVTATDYSMRVIDAS